MNSYLCLDTRLRGYDGLCKQLHLYVFLSFPRRREFSKSGKLEFLRCRQVLVIEYCYLEFICILELVFWNLNSLVLVIWNLNNVVSVI